MTTLLDVYRAAGATISEDGTSVTFTPGQLQPFDIVLRVVPHEVTAEFDRQAKIGFGVILHDEYVYGKPGLLGTPVERIMHDAYIELPVDQVRLAEDAA